MSKKPIELVLARGDGIGPEVAEATLKIIEAAGVDLKVREFLVGESAFAAGHLSGIEEGTLDAVKETGIMLKAPLNTPSGGGFRSLNVTMRNELNLWANIRPAVSYPQLDSPRGDVNTTLFRENTEGMYIGLSKDVEMEDRSHIRGLFGFAYQDLGLRDKKDFSIAMQLISEEASSRIIRSAFDFARANGSAEVHAMSKPNIIKATDGRFERNYRRLAQEYNDVSSRFSIADAGFGQSAAYPQDRGVIVTQNLYGDFLSDVMAFQAHGSLGLAPSVNIGGDQANPIAMFEAVHGTAPDIAGQGKANPTAFLMSALMMLKFAGEEDAARKIHDAVMKTWEDGQATGDVKLLKEHEVEAEFRAELDGLVNHAVNGWYVNDLYKKRNEIMEKFANRHEKRSERGSLSTSEFTASVIGNLGQKPKDDYAPCYLEDDYRALLPEAKL